MSRRSKQLARDRRLAVASPGTPAWTPFERQSYLPPTAEQIARLVRATGKSEEEVRQVMAYDFAHTELWANSRYVVIKELEARRDGLGKVWHLSFRRQDRAPVGVERFRDFQRIKNELLGPDMTGFEIYPSEARLVDTSNQYHIWAYEDGRGFPFGYIERGVLDAGNGTVQRPLSED